MSIRPCTQCSENIFHPRISLNFTSLHDRLRSEAGPASVQSDELALTLNNAELDLQDYEAEINRLEARVLFLSTQKKRLREYADRVKTLLSPIRKLPNELLRKVFDLNCEVNHFMVSELPVSTVFSSRRAPAMAISHVCSRWRKHALAMPDIWSRIALEWSVDADGEDEVSWKDDDDTFPLSLSLTRSLSRPLTFTLESDSDPLLEGRRPHPILAKLIQQAHRFQSFTFNHTTALFDFPTLFIDIAYPHFPLLEELDIHHDHTPLNYFMGKAPELKKLRLRQSLLVSVSTTAFPQLTHIDFNPEIYHFEDFLEDNPNLTSLVLNEWAPRGFTVQPKTSPRLESLTVRHERYSHDDAENSVFVALHCPSLKNLHLKFSPRLDADHPDDYPDHRPDERSWSNFGLFMTFVQRSSFPLTTLSMTGVPLLDSELVYLLNYLPTLVNLSIDDSRLGFSSPITTEFINSLHAYQRSFLRTNVSPLVPRLQSLALNYGGEHSLNDAVVGMVTSRWIPGALLESDSNLNMSTFQVDCLREFTLKMRSQKEEDRDSAVYAPLERLEKSGLRAVVSWGL
ncbi:hypothetical protein D9757_001160 [Collybiopsis confluens]|uniref:F-box domain-containing protein n=1 Tax=Collybiopsis confluens TaxID=2823264 RepID=A0A8H5MFW8_9AGAR|nr:hypothetical protein D9757_001160 [Collybiopsis confluens]